VSDLQATAIIKLAMVRSGGGAPQDPSAFSRDGHPFVRAGSLSRLLGGDDENQLERILPDVARAHRLQLFPKGTVLFAKSGMSATKGYIYNLKQPAYVVNHLAALVPRDTRDSAFLTRALQRFSPTSLIKDQAYPSIRLSDIEQMEILAPDSVEDRGRIAAILDKADALRRNRKRALDLLESLTRSILWRCLEARRDRVLVNPYHFTNLSISKLDLHLRAPSTRKRTMALDCVVARTFFLTEWIGPILPNGHKGEKTSFWIISCTKATS
jgi:hypothetical protein